MKAPAFQLYAADFDTDTAAWDCEEVGIYIRLLFSQWINGSIPDDPVRLSRITRCPLKIFIKKWEIIQEKFITSGEGKLQNKRLEETRYSQLKYSESRRKNVSTRYKDRPTHEDTHEEHMSYINSTLQSSSSLKKKHLVRKTAEASSDHTLFIQHAHETFQKRYGEKMMFDGGKDGQIVKRILSTYGLERLKELWDDFMKSDDEFLDNVAGRSIGVFKTQINKLITHRTIKKEGNFVNG